MHCTDCGWEYPYDVTFLSADCVGCGNRITPTPEEYLEYPELGIARECRTDQIKLSALLRDTYKCREIAIVEAGTGIGKSFAYLIPAILGSAGAIISTAKKSLQVQLYEKDLPFLREKLGIPFSSMILYGKSNYVCKQKVMTANHPYFSKAVGEHFFKNTTAGLWEETTHIFKNKKHLPTLAQGIPELSVDKCLGSTCKYYKECPYIDERKKIPNTDIIITNHWIVGYDFRISAEDTQVSLLGKTGKILIVDEAHKFEEALRQAFTAEIKESALMTHYKALATITNEEIPHIAPALVPLEQEWKHFFKNVKSQKGQFALTDTNAALGLNKTIDNALLHLRHTGRIDHYVHLCMQSGEASMTGAAGVLARALNNFGSETKTEASPLAASPVYDIYYDLYEFLWETAEILTGFTANKSNVVHYVDTAGPTTIIKSSPLSVAPILKGYYDCKNRHAKYSSIAYLSATLAVNKQFHNFAYRMGLSLSDPEVRQANYPTAFDYDKQAVFYVGSHLPAPEQTSIVPYRAAITVEIAELVNASKGNAFVLFTSREDLEYVLANIEGTIDPSITVVSQLESSAQTALKRFTSTPNSALFGMKSFWEGVDVSGDKLQLVIITKLPFPNSKDPIINARSVAAGDRAFSDVIIPEMISDLRQGVGRLIRTKTDRGVVALLDSRAINKSYKNVILNSLGVTKVVTDKARAIRNLEFLASQRP